MNGHEPMTVKQRNLLVVEGDDDNTFFCSLARHIGITELQIVVVGGKDRFRDRLPALVRTPGFFSPSGSCLVEHLAIVRDRDEDEAFMSIANIVRKVELVPPDGPGTFSDGSPRVGIFVMPGSAVHGTMLEDLCLETVRGHPATQCVESFAECIQGLPNPPRHASKAKCQAFLAAQAEIVNSLGVGARKGYWNLASPALGELRTFLTQMK